MLLFLGNRATIFQFLILRLDKKHAMNRLLLSAFIIWIFSTAAFAQNGIYYTINVGTFLDAKVEDFGNLQSIGFLHAQDLDNKLDQVSLGGYQDLQQAQVDLVAVRQAGYTSAYIQENFPNNGRMVAVIQLATLNSKQTVDWERFAQVGSLYAMLNGAQLKLCLGIFEQDQQARQQLPDLRKQGFKDAFVRTINSIYLHEIAAFETGNVIKKPLIPIKIEENPTTNRSKRPDNYGVDFNTKSTQQKKSVSVSPPTVELPVNTTFRKSLNTLPSIRGDQKRRSAIDLQTALKAQGLYKGSLDGFYGPGTQTAYEQFVRQDRNYQKFKLLAQYEPVQANDTGDRLQRAINNLPSNPQGLAGYPQAVAKAYQAYVLLTTRGPSSEVNRLMNTAIQEAFANTPRQMVPGFDFTATYAYNDLGQLISHVFNIHAAPAVSYTLPCWMTDLHPQEVAAASAPFLGSGRLAKMQSCDAFTSWEELQVLEKIAEDFLVDAQLDQEMVTRASAARSSLYLIETPLGPEMSKELDEWHQTLWRNADVWAQQDQINRRDVNTLRIAYFQAQVRLEDFFMDKNFRPQEARHLALATLRSSIGYYLKKFGT